MQFTGKVKMVESLSPMGKNGKPYQVAEVTYNSEYQGKMELKSYKAFEFADKEMYKKILSLKGGDAITIEAEKDAAGKYWVWKSISLGGEISTSAATSATQSSPSVKSAYIPDDLKQRLIVRQNCVGNAIGALKMLEGNIQEEFLAGRIIQMASIFEKFVYEGKYAPPKNDYSDLESEFDDNGSFDPADDEIPN